MSEDAAAAARAQILTLLSAGSLRELIRLADQSWPPLADSDGIDRDHWLIMKTLEAEASALLGEIINVYSAQNGTGDVIVKVWNRLPHEAFSSVDGFVELSRSDVFATSGRRTGPTLSGKLR